MITQSNFFSRELHLLSSSNQLDCLMFLQFLIYLSTIHTYLYLLFLMHFLSIVNISMNAFQSEHLIFNFFLQSTFIELLNCIF